MSRYLHWLLVFWIAASAVSCGDDAEKYHRPDGPGPWILVDLYHSTKQNPVDYRLEKGNFNYQGVFAFWRFFEHIQDNGYKTVYINQTPLSTERLDGFDVLFINLVSDDLPDFSKDEVDAIIQFVEEGGGLYVIVDHTNVYRHAERVNKFLEPMGVEALYHIATDQPPTYSIAGLGWILVRTFADHPVTRDVDMISLQTGGPVRSEDSGVAFTSACEGDTAVNCSFADLWDPEDPHGFYGNWRWDGDAEAEPLGPLEVVVAHEYGEGRIVVVGDQNIFGDSWLHFGNNFELAVNGMEWLARREDTSRPLRDIRPMGLNIGSLQPPTKYLAGKNVNEGYFGYYVNENRNLNVTSRGLERLDMEDDVLMLMNPSEPFSGAELDNIRRYLADGKPVVLTFEISEINDPILSVLREFAPDFKILVEGTQFTLNDAEALKSAAIPKGAGVRAMSSDVLDVDGLKIASFVRETETKAGEEVPVYRPYLSEVTSSWGEPFLSAGGADLARVSNENGGPFVVFMQDGCFRGRTMGDYLTAPNGDGVTPGKSMAASGYADAHKLQFALHAWFQEVTDARDSQ